APENELRESGASSRARGGGTQALDSRAARRLRFIARRGERAGLLHPPPALNPGRREFLSRAVEDSRQAPLVFAFPLESETNGFERVGQGKNLRAHPEVRIFGSDWMPVNAFRSDRDLRN